MCAVVNHRESALRSLCTGSYLRPLPGLRSSCAVLPVPGCLTGPDPLPEVFSIFNQSNKAMRVLRPQVNSCGSQSIKVNVGESIEERLDDIRQKVFQRECRVPRIREAQTCLTRGIEVQVLNGNVVSSWKLTCISAQSHRPSAIPEMLPESKSILTANRSATKLSWD